MINQIYPGLDLIYVIKTTFSLILLKNIWEKEHIFPFRIQIILVFEVKLQLSFNIENTLSFQFFMLEKI